MRGVTVAAREGTGPSSRRLIKGNHSRGAGKKVQKAFVDICHLSAMDKCTGSQPLKNLPFYDCVHL